MTVRNLRLPVVMATGTLVYAWVLTVVPFGLSLGLRGANGFLMIVLIVWFGRRVLSMLADIRAFLQASEESRAAAVEALAARADAINEKLEIATGERQSELVAAIEEGTAASKEAQREANSVNQKIADLDQRIIDVISPKSEPT